MDRLGFWGLRLIDEAVQVVVFQYPLMDRLGFWGGQLIDDHQLAAGFSIR